MKFRHYLESITCVGIYPLASLFIFLVFFTLLALWAVKAKKSYIEAVKNIPLGNDNDHQ